MKIDIHYGFILGFMVHCGDCELFSHTMLLTHHTFVLNLAFLMNCGDGELFCIKAQQESNISDM